MDRATCEEQREMKKYLFELGMTVVLMQCPALE